MLELLIKNLKELEESDVEYKVYLTDADPQIPLVAKIVELAESELITVGGSPKFFAHFALENAGFRVTAGEKDSFGWLTGVIHTNKGMIVYG